MNGARSSRCYQQAERRARAVSMIGAC